MSIEISEEVRQAARKAFSAGHRQKLEENNRGGGQFYKIDGAVEAGIEAALAAALPLIVGEPVAYRCEWHSSEGWAHYHDEDDPIPMVGENAPDLITPLYAIKQGASRE